MEAKKRIAVIDYEQCSPQKCGNWYCESVCPVNRNQKECISHEAQEQPHISEELCIGCLICVKKCPFNAISVINLSIEPGRVLHQFGENQFRLHRFPLPRFGEVIGLIGKNGIGKTTAIDCLSGKTIPNLGNFAEKGNWANVLETFKGKEAFAFFEKVSQNQVKIAVKPQNIEAIRNAKQKIGKLLQQVDEKNQFQETIQELGLEKVLDHLPKELSGGELQKTAIAATALKKSDVYFFDEPSSFLDIRERLRIASFIRGLVTEKTSVMVVEHDLILLDYLSDKIHLMYGTPSVFGIVSQVKTSREGINEYLEGFSRDENYRFRYQSIEFFAKSAKETKKGAPLFSWPKLEKKLGSFELTVEKNCLNQHEVVGVLGPNAIGKTTFVQLLAGTLKPDNITLNQSLKIAYKPQYLERPKNLTVTEAFQKKIKLSHEELSNTILKPLEIESVWEKKFSILSGGELQRTAIALTLAQNADIMLMDEPSAGLDVEQRISIAKTIRSTVERTGKSALIVDHDLLFTDYISDRLMVFSGKPAVQGKALGPFSMETGMNTLLKEMNITLRRDKTSKRPRINKSESVLDREQKKSGKYYYA
ncbi:ribosome biogenesis/translation initiation ATPase RLI [Candidatus Micrarchaeota archaeon]|nr:ribosome biogenesis/translation initiation ATPase RLI [Candidatus Micrarchaeota archaeon]MBU1930363.1 ribosome biogenesis/translation initiation ATPase RLI [Candidatus Micrarchaeota archaeon]